MGEILFIFLVVVFLFWLLVSSIKSERKRDRFFHPVNKEELGKEALLIVRRFESQDFDGRTLHELQYQVSNFSAAIRTCTLKRPVEITIWYDLDKCEVRQINVGGVDCTDIFSETEARGIFLAAEKCAKRWYAANKRLHEMKQEKVMGEL